MIEIIYNNESTEKGKVNGMSKMPKNIRQVGEIEPGKKIYIEDYVITYINQLAGKDYVNQYVAVLLGYYSKVEGKKSVFISGAVEVKDVQSAEQEDIFINDAWTTIYENIKKYFSNLEIVGWFLAKPGYQAELNEDIIKNHINNFAGAEKILFMLDSIEKEEAIYVYENNELKKQKGYYIYYEKNEEMQNYMVEEREVMPIEQEQEDTTIKDIRAIIQEKKQEINPKGAISILYGASTVLIIAILVIGVTMLNNYDKMKAMEETLNTISNKLSPNEDEDEAVEAMNQNVITKVDRIEGNIEEVTKGAEKDQEVKPTKEQTDNKSNDEKTTTTEHVEPTKENIEIERTTSEVTDASGKITRYYEIKSGDTLAEICRSLYGNTENIEIIQEINEIENTDMILAGQKIIVP